jgi:hypothetical protein
MSPPGINLSVNVSVRVSTSKSQERRSEKEVRLAEVRPEEGGRSCLRPLHSKLDNKGQSRQRGHRDEMSRWLIFLFSNRVFVDYAIIMRKVSRK